MFLGLIHALVIGIVFLLFCNLLPRHIFVLSLFVHELAHNNPLICLLLLLYMEFFFSLLFGFCFHVSAWLIVGKDENIVAALNGIELSGVASVSVWLRL